MVPGWSERDRESHNAMRDAWIGSRQRYEHTRCDCAGPWIGAVARVFLRSVRGAVRSTPIAQRPETLGVPLKAQAPGRGPRFTHRMMQGGIR